MTDTPTTTPAKKAGFIAWLKSGGPGLTIAFFSALAAALSAAVALIQMLFLLNERSTPYRTAVHTQQVETAREVAATAIQYWEALAAGLAGCRGYQSGQAGWSWENNVRPRFEEEARTYYEFRKAIYAGQVTFAPKVLDAGRQLSNVVYGAMETYGSRNCEESVTLDDDFPARDEYFIRIYHDFVNAVRADASIDLLSERPDMMMPK
jgi:hypothetical protein